MLWLDGRSPRFTPDRWRSAIEGIILYYTRGAVAVLLVMTSAKQLYRDEEDMSLPRSFGGTIGKVLLVRYPKNHSV